MPRSVPTRTGPSLTLLTGIGGPRRSAAAVRAGSGGAARGSRARFAAAALGGVALAGASLVGLAAPAAAASGSGPDGQQLTVSVADGLDPAGQAVRVSGRGYDVSKGIYVALCVDNGAGAVPSPCIGGVDMEGASGSSAWISSNPPAYGEGLAVPFSGSGGFDVTLSVQSSDPFTDCLDPAVAPRGCVLSTRADHTRTGDRSADVRVPVTFSAGGAAAGGSGSGPGGGSGSGNAPAGAAAGGAGSDRAPGADAGAGTDADGLASTGVETGTVVAAAGLLAAAGAGVLLATRRSALTRRAAVVQDDNPNSTRPGA